MISSMLVSRLSREWERRGGYFALALAVAYACCELVIRWEIVQGTQRRVRNQRKYSRNEFESLYSFFGLFVFLEGGLEVLSPRGG